LRNIILFGPAGAGKTTVANMIIGVLRDKSEETRVIKVSQGNKIKVICNDLKYNNKKEKRELQQAVGQEMRRIFGNDVWCEVTKKEIVQVKNMLGLGMAEDRAMFVIDDGRQHNEYDFWTKERFLAVGVIADLETRAKRLLERDGYDQKGNLRFENEITADDIAREKCQYLIRNEGTMEDLRELVVELIDMVAERTGDAEGAE